MGYLNEWARDIWDNASAKGFHGEDGKTIPPTAELIANLHGEVSELWEAYRKKKLDAPCDKDTFYPLSCAEEELADILIRTLDTAFALGVDMDRAVAVKHAYNKTRPYRHGGKLA